MKNTHLGIDLEERELVVEGSGEELKVAEGKTGLQI